MKTFKWRLILSTLNLGSAISLSALGMQQYQTFRRLHPFAFYEGTFVYIPPSQLVSDCLNAPAFVLANLLGNIRAWKYFWAGSALGGTVFHDVNVTFYALLFVFWWWIGWRIDIKSRHSSLTVLAALFWVASALLSLILAYAGTQILRTSQLLTGGVSGQRFIAISMLGWGIGLFCYCARMLSSFREPG